MLHGIEVFEFDTRISHTAIDGKRLGNVPIRVAGTILTLITHQQHALLDSAWLELCSCTPS